MTSFIYEAIAKSRDFSKVLEKHGFAPKTSHKGHLGFTMHHWTVSTHKKDASNPVDDPTGKTPSKPYEKLEFHHPKTKDKTGTGMLIHTTHGGGFKKFADKQDPGYKHPEHHRTEFHTADELDKHLTAFRQKHPKYKD